MHLHLFSALLALLITTPALSQSLKQPKAPGIESAGYVWNQVQAEELLALRASGNAERGAEAYRVCHGCHKAGALGTPDGTYPRLAGQHDTVLIKQLVDIRRGQRDNQTMYPFASEHGISTQELADLAAYISRLPATAENGLGDGSQLARGKTLYEKDCKSCHGAHGEGMAEKFYPRVAGQHYRYLDRTVRDIRDGQRRNANPQMVKIIRKYKDADLSALADYMARLQPAPAQKP